ncbi:hypothetical protein C8Q73DRAFT_793667 [Cubamyces lactineus]|nr:hypothetical protein C8Q73DRAFT_793667 [Cubamyces lactineus]
MVNAGVSHLIQRTDQLEDTVADLRATIALVEESVVRLVATGSRDKQSSDTKSNAVELAKERNNALHDAVRKCLYSLMGISTSEKLPRPLGGGTFWESRPMSPQREGLDGETLMESILRPDWDRPWAVNKKGWVYRATSRIKANGHDYTSALSQEQLESLSRDTIDHTIQVVFKNLVRNWKLQTEGNGMAQKQARNLSQKMNGRKKTKVEARESVRYKVLEAGKPEYDFLFQWQYQSSDESEVEEIVPLSHAVIDPDTEDEGDIKPNLRGRAKARKVWVSHAPAWRLPETNTVLDMLDVHVSQQRAENTSGRGNMYRPRKRGDPRPDHLTSLPVLTGSKSTIRIPYDMINPAWLEGEFGESFNTRKYIADDEEARTYQLSNDGSCQGEEGEGQASEQANGGSDCRGSPRWEYEAEGVESVQGEHDRHTDNELEYE